jgi:hypothetical protein
MPVRPRTIGARGAAAVTLTALAIGPASGCGVSDQERGLSSRERATLQQKLSEVRRAAVSRDRSAAETALDEFVDEVGALEVGGALDAEAASAMLTGAARARRQLAVEVKPPAPPPPPTRTQAPEKKPKAQKEDRQGDDDDGGKDRKGRGQGKDDGKGD